MLGLNQGPHDKKCECSKVNATRERKTEYGRVPTKNIQQIKNEKYLKQQAHLKQKEQVIVKAAQDFVFERGESQFEEELSEIEGKKEDEDEEGEQIVPKTQSMPIQVVDWFSNTGLEAAALVDEN